jgi:hypothetical protein
MTGNLKIDVTSMSGLEDEDDQFGIFDLADQPIVAYPVSPKTFVPIPLQGDAVGTRVLLAHQSFDPHINPLPGLHIEFRQFFKSLL